MNHNIDWLYSPAKWLHHTVATRSSYCCYALVLNWFCVVKCDLWDRSGRSGNEGLWHSTSLANYLVYQSQDVSSFIIFVLRSTITFFARAYWMVSPLTRISVITHLAKTCSKHTHSYSFWFYWCFDTTVLGKANELLFCDNTEVKHNKKLLHLHYNWMPQACFNHWFVEKCTLKSQTLVHECLTIPFLHFTIIVWVTPAFCKESKYYIFWTILVRQKCSGISPQIIF